MILEIILSVYYSCIFIFECLCPCLFGCTKCCADKYEEHKREVFNDTFIFSEENEDPYNIVLREDEHETANDGRGFETEPDAETDFINPYNV